MVSAPEMEFYCAATTGNLAVVDRFLSQTADQHDAVVVEQIVASQSFAGHSVLHGACNVNRNVHALLARPLIRRICLNLRDVRLHRTPLQTCLAVGHNDLALRLLQEEEIDVTNRDDDDRTALHLACYFNRSLRVVQALIDASSSLLYQRDKYGKTPLLYACDCGNVTVVQLLLSIMSHVNETTTTWHWELAHVRGALEIPQYKQVARLVLNAGMTVRPSLRAKRPYQIHRELLAWIQAQLQDPAQLIRTAAAQGNIVALQSLLGIQPCNSSSRNQPTQSTSKSPLHSKAKTATSASSHNNESTALHGAARYGQAAAVGLLLQAGACSPWQVDETGITPIQIAVQWGHLHVVEEILRYTIVGV